MQEYNEAWAVLRNPAARAAYDVELAEREQLGSVRPAVRVTPLRTDRDVDGLVAPTPMSARPSIEDVAPGNGCGLFLGVAAALLVGVVVIGVLAAWVASSSTSSAPVELGTRERYAVGTCILVTPVAPVDTGTGAGTTERPGGDAGSGGAEDGSEGAREGMGLLGANDVVIDEVPCSGTVRRSGRVTARVRLPLPCPTGSAAIVLPNEEVSLCVAR